MSKQRIVQQQLLLVLIILLIIFVIPVVASTCIKNTSNNCQVLAECMTMTSTNTNNNRSYTSKYQPLHNKLDPTAVVSTTTALSPILSKGCHSHSRNVIIRQQQQQQQHDNNYDKAQIRISTSILIPRGGGGGTSNTITNSIVQFVNYISQSYQRCFILLVCSILCENFGISLSKQARNVGSIKLFLCSTLLNMLCLIGFNISLSQIEVSVAYAIWSAVGTMIVSTIGILYFNESCSILKLCCLSLIAIGVIGLNLI